VTPKIEKNATITVGWLTPFLPHVTFGNTDLSDIAPCQTLLNCPVIMKILPLK